MRDQSWRTLAEIEEETGDPQSSISAQLRHLRKRRFGEHDVDKRRRVSEKSCGTWEYRLRINPGAFVELYRTDEIRRPEPAGEGAP